MDYIRVYEDRDPGSIDGQEVWDCEYELTWDDPADDLPDGGEVDVVTGTEDLEFYFIVRDPALVDITIDWDNNANNEEQREKKNCIWLISI